MAGRLAVAETRPVAPEVERRLEAAVAVAPARVAVVDGLAEAVVPEVDVLELSVGALAPVVVVVGLRTVPAAPVVPAVVFFSAVLPGLDTRVLVLLAAVEVKVDFLSSSLALTLGRLRWLEVVDVEVVGRRAAVVVEVGGRVGGLLSPPVRAAAVAPAAVRDEAVVPVAAVRRAVAEVVGALVRLAAGEVEAALALDGVSGDMGVDSLEEGAASELGATSMFSLSAIFDVQLGYGKDFEGAAEIATLAQNAVILVC